METVGASRYSDIMSLEYCYHCGKPVKQVNGSCTECDQSLLDQHPDLESQPDAATQAAEKEAAIESLIEAASGPLNLGSLITAAMKSGVIKPQLDYKF